MLEEFKKYVSNYDLDNYKIKSKLDHSIRVMDLSTKYALEFGFNDEDVELATVIGLLHDIGRFEQLRVYDCFDDVKTIDHADYSVTQLFEKGEIKKFCLKEEWYPIIEFAIKNHNKLVIDETNDERCLKQARLIRDVDKLDIMRILASEARSIPDDSVINDKVLDSIRKCKPVNRKDVVTKNDKIAVQYAFAFDIYSDGILREYKKEFIRYHDQIEDERFDEIYKIVINYLDERIDKYERNRNKV